MFFGRAGEHAGIPNTRVSTQAVSRVFQRLIQNTFQCDVFQACAADSGFAPAKSLTLHVGPRRHERGPGPNLRARTELRLRPKPLGPEP